MQRLILTLCGLAAILAPMSACGPSATPQVTINHVERRATLPNGIKLVVMPDKTSNMVQVDVRYAVGSKEDPANKAGLAHLVEHMMFQHRFGSTEIPVEQRQPTFETLPQKAAFFNAYTHTDSTHYNTLVRKEDLPWMLQLEAARMFTGCKTIQKAEFDRELEVVRNEIRWRSGAAAAQVDNEILKRVYPKGHAYSESVGGNDSQLANIEFQDVCKFMSDYYVPEMVTLVVTGNVTEQEVGTMVGRYFGGMEKRASAPTKPVEPIEIEYAKHEVEIDIDRTIVTVSWAMPAMSDDKFQAAQTMLSLVTGRVNRFAEDWNFGRVMGVSFIGGLRAPVLAIKVELKPGKTANEALGYIWKAVESVRKDAGMMLESGGYDSEQMGKSQSKLGMIEGLESIGARSGWMADKIQFDAKAQRDFGGDATFLYQDLEKLDKLDWEEFKGFVRKMLSKKRAMVLIAKASDSGLKGDTRDDKQFEADPEKIRNKPLVDVSEAKRALNVPSQQSLIATAESYQLGNGMKVILLPYEGMPLVDFRVVFPVGDAHSPESKAGLGDIATSFLNMPRDATAFQASGIRFGASTGMTSTTFHAAGMNIYLKEVVNAPERLLKAGVISQKNFEDWRNNYKANFKRISFQRNYQFQVAMQEARYGEDHPFVKNAFLTPKSLENIGRDAAFDFLRGKLKAKGTTLILVGNFDVEAAKTLIQDTYGGWGGSSVQDPVSAAAPARQGPTYIGVVGDDTVPTATVQIVYPIEGGLREGHAARTVLGEILSRRMMLVRTELGSSYGVGAGFSLSKGPSAYTIRGPVDALRLGESIKFMREQIAELRAGEGLLEDFVAARRKILNQLLSESAVRNQLASTLSFYEAYNKDASYRDQFIRDVASVTPEQIQQLLTTELDPKNEIIGAFAKAAVLEPAFQEAGLADYRIIEPTGKK